MSLTTPHIVSLGMFSYWPTALQKTANADTERVSVPDTLYQRLVQKDRREERAFGFIRESYRAWRLTGMEARKVIVTTPEPMKAEAPTNDDLVDALQLFHDEMQDDDENDDHRIMQDNAALCTPTTYEAMAPLTMAPPHAMCLESPPTTDLGSVAEPPAPTKKRKFRKCGSSDATKVLRDWLFDPHHQEHPYPSEKEKKLLSDESGLTIKQIGIWFRNARQRLCQPTPSKMTIHPEQAASFMQLVSLRHDEATPLRRGAWSAEENLYAQRLIELFTQGHMPILEGTPLRSFLAMALHCHTMRISKKFVRDSSVGKITFRRDRIFNAHGGVFEGILQDLLHLKARVLETRPANVASQKHSGDDAAFQVQAWLRNDPPAFKAEPPPPLDDAMENDMLDAFEFDLLGATFGPYEIDPTVAAMLSP
ncbi:hypothetical protein SDRG_00332 [Saprolegnia diclina VS20]|uniref:Homeobox domain-containing protein n=1 Tax=Saprolegnia diclina (strain VS20) TaxID=1156394 RepID=T0SB43_SAPDV|nr:hypothetical protein SDRG_00332 [Saprolegnia diclina VS20]EQC42603.1 hypothetical protein SDRG_00332 [Saprolegnia diclina VS20]|eukprot:XP_008604026.1 hypothetical protein SDRG_00332 [Saprolegnia diclina VS20]